jgi:hypothetical protein
VRNFISYIHFAKDQVKKERLIGYIARKGKRNAYKVSMGKPEEKRPLGRLRIKL